MTRVNANILNDHVRLLSVIAELGVMVGQILPDWDPHQRLEYVKMSIRAMIGNVVGQDRNELKINISELEESHVWDLLPTH